MCDTNFATPANTTGMGNPSVGETPEEIGSGDVFTPIEKEKKRKKMKNLKDYLKKK